PELGEVARRRGIDTASRAITTLSREERDRAISFGQRDPSVTATEVELLKTRHAPPPPEGACALVDDEHANGDRALPGVAPPPATHDCRVVVRAGGEPPCVELCRE